MNHIVPVLFLTGVMCFMFAAALVKDVDAKIYKRDRKGRFSGETVKKEKRVILVKEGDKIISYFTK